MSKIQHIIVFASLIIAISSCKKEEVPEVEHMTIEIDGRSFEAADIETEISGNVLEITAMDIAGEVIKIQFNNEVRKGEYDFRSTGIPALHLMNQDGEYDSFSGELKVLEHDRDKLNIRATFHCRVKSQDSSDEFELSNGSFNVNY